MDSNIADIADAVAAHLRNNGITVPSPEGVFTTSPVPEDTGQVDENGKQILKKITLPGEGILISKFAHALGQLLRESGAPIYNREGVPTLIDSRTGTAFIVEPVPFRTFIEKYCTPTQTTIVGNGVTTRPASMTKETAAAVIECSDFIEQLHPLTSVHNQRLPIQRADGTICLLPLGYDQESRIYTAPTALKYRDDLPFDEAVTLWRDYHSEFPFADWSRRETILTTAKSRSFAVHTSCSLAQYCSAMFPPGLLRLTFVYNSNSQRSGKSLLAKIAIGITHGRSPITPFERADDKLKNTLDVLIRNRAAFAFFDNLRGKIASTHLESLVASPSLNIRPFHTQNLIEYTNNTGVIITGNDLSWNTDFGNRILVCDLQMDEANPQNRTLRRIYDDTTHLEAANRSDLLACLWSFVNHWATTGRTTPKKTRAGFERFGSLIGGITIATGLGNPLDDRPDDIYGGGDTDANDMADLIAQLADKIPEGETMAKFRFHELVKVCIDRNSFPTVLEGSWREEEIEDPNDEFGTTMVKVYKLTTSSNKRFSAIISGQYGGRTFTLPDGRRVKWDSRGKKRGRWYEIYKV